MNIIWIIIYEHYKDQNFIEANRNLKLHLYNNFKEEALP